ncbi:transcription activator of gluconeogenesis ERT1 [Hyaloraphidium curvatum]|nr:transcription activator of gluconeogenesis ERT1 [Hyaloraphidium curvatum]
MLTSFSPRSYIRLTHDPACFHCQKAHLTCDDTRPCSRCLKRGLADSCTDGFRKKAKYLADVGDADLRADTPPPGARPPKPRPQAPLQHAPLLATSPPPLLQPQPHMANPSALQHPDPSLFSSDSINLEYAMLSNMLQQQGFPLPPAPAAVFPPAPAPARTTTPALPTQQAAHAAYQAVSRPYDYRQGFHHLVAYIKSRFQKDDIMRICRALAHFRPSFMAQIMNLSEEDLVFMEKCFQRTLVEYEKLINCSGTPTVVWRRTGEVALVGKEFSLLTGWGREGLVGKKTYIYELMDTASAVDYWEKFSLIAFDNSQQSVMTTCNLVTPQGRSVPCAFCFTIKRDIFDVPLAIVGAFLPSFDKMAAS